MSNWRYDYKRRLCFDQGELLTLGGWALRPTTEVWAMSPKFQVYEVSCDEHIRFHNTLEDAIEDLKERNND